MGSDDRLPIRCLHFQKKSERIGRNLSLCFSYWEWIYFTQNRLVSHPYPWSGDEASMAKLFASETVTYVTHQAAKIHGGMGCLQRTAG